MLPSQPKSFSGIIFQSIKEWLDQIFRNVYDVKKVNVKSGFIGLELFLFFFFTSVQKKDMTYGMNGWDNLLLVI